MSLNDRADGVGRKASLVELEDRHKQREFDVHLLGRDRFHVREDFQRLLLGAFVVQKILVGWRSHGTEGFSKSAGVKVAVGRVKIDAE